MSRRRELGNAPGDFYVERGSCMGCGAPKAVAPDLVTMCGGEEGRCYFHRQPETPAEVQAAIEAIRVSCMGVHRYGGRDPSILRRVAEAGDVAALDHPPTHEIHIRNRARFACRTIAIEGAVDLVGVLVEWIAKAHPGFVGAVTGGDAARATFELSATSEHGPSYVLGVFGVERLGDDGWLVVANGAERPPVWLHRVLTERGVDDLRWFSDAEWTNGSPGRPHPYE